MKHELEQSDQFVHIHFDRRLNSNADLQQVLVLDVQKELHENTGLKGLIVAVSVVASSAVIRLHHCPVEDAVRYINVFVEPAVNHTVEK